MTLLKNIPRPSPRTRVAAYIPLLTLAVLLLIPSRAHAQISPWERAAMNLQTAFTGPIARSLSLVAIVLAMLMMQVESGHDHHSRIAKLIFGVAGAMSATTMLAWIYA